MACPCESADRWTEWKARYVPNDHEHRYEWKGNFCGQCGRDVTAISVGTPLLREAHTHDST